ncbi:MAG: HDOD domain-containing protein [Thermodesulfobacteriota bacterium]
MDLASSPNQTLAEIFNRANLGELPAMSAHVRELIDTLNNENATAHEIAEVILKDASLTTKLLQVANSAYYNRGVPILSVSRAITSLGLAALKELTMTLALFEDFLQAGVEKEEISKLLAQCFASATQAKLLCKAKQLNAPEEEVFICTLLHQLGKIIVLVYLPDMYRKIEEMVEHGYSDDFASRTILNDLSFARIGMEMARFWNFSQKVILSMDENPPSPTSKVDSQLYLLNVAVFSNQLTQVVCHGTDLDLSELLLRFGPMMGVNRREALTLLNRSVDAADDMGGIIRAGISKLKLRSRLAQKAAH